MAATRRGTGVVLALFGAVMVVCALPLRGQIYALRYPQGGFVLLDGTRHPTTTIANAPQWSHFTIVVDTSGGKTLIVSFTSVPNNDATSVQATVAHRNTASAVDSVTHTNNPRAVVTEGGALYAIPKDQMTTDFYELAYGLDIGTLAIPFKWQVGSDGTLTGGATLGAYVGYRFWHTTAVASIGYAAITTASPSLSTTQPATTSTTGALTLAGGVVFDLGPSAQFGFIFGWDVGVDKSTYVYANKLWISMAIGANFIRH